MSVAAYIDRIGVLEYVCAASRSDRQDLDGWLGSCPPAGVATSAHGMHGVMACHYACQWWKARGAVNCVLKIVDEGRDGTELPLGPTGVTPNLRSGAS